MTIGVIGLGSIGERHVRNIQTMYPNIVIEILTRRIRWKDAGQNTKLVALSSQFFKTRHDIYFVTNETGKHMSTIMQCLRQKPKGLFVEKPLTASVRDIAPIRKHTKNTKVFFVGYCLQFYKPLLRMKSLLEEGAIGTVRAMRVSVGSDVRAWRKGDYRKRYSVDAKRGGGVILDLVHELNYPAWLLEESLHFVAGLAARVALPIKAEDISEGIFRTKKGAVVSIHQDFFQTPSRRSCEIIGSKGTLLWDGDTITIRTKKVRSIDVSEDRNTMYRKELAWFMKKVQSGKRYSNFEEAGHDLANADKLKKTYAPTPILP